MNTPHSSDEEESAGDEDVRKQTKPLSFNNKKPDNGEGKGARYRRKESEDEIERHIRSFLIWFRRKLLRSKPTDLIMSIATVMLFFVGIGQFVVAWVNYESTSPLVDYARRNTEAAEKFKKAAEGINQGVSNAVIQLGEQAGASKTIAAAADTSAKIAQIALQPAIGTNIVMGTLGTDSMQYQLNIRNEGGSSALVTFHYCAFSNPVPKPLASIDDCGSTIKTSGPDAILAHNSFPIAISISDAPGIKIADVVAGKTYLFMPVKLEYPIEGMTRTLKFCYVYEPVFKSMGECGDLMTNNNTQQQKH